MTQIIFITPIFYTESYHLTTNVLIYFTIKRAYRNLLVSMTKR